MRSLTSAAITSLADCALGVERRVGTLLLVVALLLMGMVPPFLNGLAVFAHKHALAPGPRQRWVASARGGVPHPWRGSEAGPERAERSGGLHKRSAEDWGASCARVEAELPSRLGFLAWRGGQKDALAVVLGVGVAGRNRSAEVGDGRRRLFRRQQSGRKHPCDLKLFE